ncbi:unnamed protein product [Rotaria socialis]|uniref:Nuclear receptor domain-containing protein n=2 Tax=Rotaria socialis TaxID=392032 RepID=A0A818TTJ3_9BILA|nr:unnamed protein product [Rotaria socialis]
MSAVSCHLINHRNYSKFTHNSINAYLQDPNLSVSDMIDQYDVTMVNGENAKKKKSLRCVVCSGRAFGYNFDQISCESCKAFFRRNALRDMSDLHCRFSGNCNITVESRRHCSYCRIMKCFAVGMRKESIRSEVEKYMKRLQLDKGYRQKYPQATPKIPALMTIGNANILMMLSSTDRTRVNNITHCYDQYTYEPSSSGHFPPLRPLVLRIDEFFNRKKPIFINLISYFKHLPELKRLNLDDQVLLIKQNIRLLIPLNYAILQTPVNSKFRGSHIQTTGLYNNINIHEMLRQLSSYFVGFVTYDPIIIKLLITVLFFTSSSSTTRSIFDPAQYRELSTIKEIQSSYIELLWVYMIEKFGEKNAIYIFTKMITKYLSVQIVIDQVDTIVRMNNDIQNIDSLMQSFLQLT